MPYEDKKTVALNIDGKDVEVPRGTTILEAAKRVGIEIPSFCYHPKLSIAGNCRVCAVEVEGLVDPVISCREQVEDGMVVHTDSPLAVDARRSALEFILINHPLDCPVCDCAGECKLQDYYAEYSLRPSRFVENKIKKPKMVDAGPNVILDAERCVSCTRCIRFCEEVVGNHQIGLAERGGYQEITAPGTLTNDYSLCTVDICPVGALLSKDFKFKKRVWFLISSPSVCTGCATGCNTWIDHENGVPYRIRPRPNESINGDWMCDEGRITYKRLKDESRILKPTVLENSEARNINWNEAIHLVATRIKDYKKDRIAGIISAKATLEENAAFFKLFRDVIQTDNIFVSSEPEDTTFGDDFLRDVDRNPNSRGATIFTKTRLTDKATYDICIILGTPTENEQSIIRNMKPLFTLLIASNCDEIWADVVLPLAPPEEQEGTLINRAGIQQRIYPAYAARGKARPGWHIAEDIAQALDKPMSIITINDAHNVGKYYMKE